MTTLLNTAEIQRENRRRIIAYFESGIADEGTRRLGVEVEHFIVQNDTLKPVCYESLNGALSVKEILEYLKRFYPQESRNSQGDLLGLANETGSITLEPAAQLEISIAPFERIEQVRDAYRAFRLHLDPFLSNQGCHAATFGYHPSACANDLPLIPKERYGFMNAHFEAIGTHGERMMRASGSTQVSIDYFSEADAVRKLRIATALGPVLASIADNVPAFEGKRNSTPLARLDLWRNVDNARCGTIPGMFDEDFGFASYADWLLRTPPIFITRPAANDPKLRSFTRTPAAEAYADALMDQRDIEHLISMFWPDTRLKRFVEIRQADCLPAECIYGYAALVKGLFYSEESLRTIEDALGVDDGTWPLDDSSVDTVIAEIRRDGTQAQAYGMPIGHWTELLFDLAFRSLEPSESAFLPPLRDRERPLK